MADEEILETDQGATGEPETEADGSGIQDEDIEAGVSAPVPEPEPPGNDEDDFYRKVAELDPSKLPDSLRAKLERPFLQDYTRKYQDLSHQQQRILEAVSRRLSDGGVTPTMDETTQLREKIRSGDLDVLDQYVDRIVQERVRPALQQTVINNAVENAKKLHPYVSERQDQLISIVQNDPAVRQLATMEDYRYAPQVLAGLAYQLEAQELRQQVQALHKEREAFEDQKREVARRAIESYQKRIAGLPAKTTMAGTSSASAPDKQALSVKEAAQMAWEQMGGQPIPYWK